MRPRAAPAGLGSTQRNQAVNEAPANDRPSDPSEWTAVVLAAGRGTRMRSALPKVLFFGDSISGGYSKSLIKLMEGKAEADFARCVDISTRAAIKEMVAPGLLAVSVAPGAGRDALGPPRNWPPLAT